MKPLEQLNEKVGLLLKKTAALEKENALLKGTIAKHQDELRKTRQNSGSMDAVGALLASDAVGDEDKKEMRAKLDVVIGEIDKILATLND